MKWIYLDTAEINHQTLVFHLGLDSKGSMGLAESFDKSKGCLCSSVYRTEGQLLIPMVCHIRKRIAEQMAVFSFGWITNTKSSALQTFGFDQTTGVPYQSIGLSTWFGAATWPNMGPQRCNSRCPQRSERKASEMYSKCMVPPLIRQPIPARM